MSYILDALRKADAQRERDAAHGIHAPPAGLGAASATQQWAAPRHLLAVVVALAVIAAAFAAWLSMRAAPTPDAQGASAALSVQMAPPAARTMVAAPPATAISPPPQRPMPSTVLPLPPPLIAPPPIAQGTQGAPQAAAPLITGALPPDAPKVAISGGVYSPSPTQRMLIVNGQVFNEGSEVAGGVVLEEVKSRTAILRFRGARYQLAY